MFMEDRTVFIIICYYCNIDPTLVATTARVLRLVGSRCQESDNKFVWLAVSSISNDGEIDLPEDEILLHIV